MIHVLNIAPVEECWKNSRLSLGPLLDSTAIQLDDKPLWMSILITVIIIFSLLILDRIVIAARTSWSLLFRRDRIKEYLDNNSRIMSQNISIVVVLPLLALILIINSVSIHSFLYTLILFVSITVFKILAVKIIKWIDGGGKKIEEVIPFFCSNIILSTLSVLPIAITRIFLPISQLAFNISCLIITGIYFVISLFRLRQRILNARFSHIFCFLYLCALEILPFVLTIRLILV